MPTNDAFGRIDWVADSCRLLGAIAAEYRQTLPFAGLTIGTAIHLEPKTAVLLATLQAGGARVVSTGNLSSTQETTIAWLKRQDIEIVGERTTDTDAHDRFLDAVVARRPDLLLDNGGDLFSRAAAKPYPGLRGGTEETTSGRMRLEPMRDALPYPVLVINDSPIKQFAENRHAVGQSLFESYLRFTNRATNGKRVSVFGYGACGKGTAACFRNAHAIVSVVDIDPVVLLEAHLDGFATPSRDEALRSADVIVTVTGSRHVVTAADLPLLRHGTVLVNGGHFPVEIDAAGLRESDMVARIRVDAEDGIETMTLQDGRAIHLLGGGHMANLAGPRPLGNSIESMDLGFSLQARCLERIAGGGLDARHSVVPVPADIDAAVARAYLELER